MSLLKKGVTAHTALTDKEAAGVIDHANVSVTDAKIASGVGLADTNLLKLPVAAAGKVIKRGAGAWEAGDESGIIGVTVRKNTRMPVIGIRPQLNLIEGGAIDIQLADNPSDDEIDITLSTKYPTRFKVLIPDDAAEAVPAAETKAALANVIGANIGYEALDFDPDAEEVVYWEEFLTPDYLSENIVADIFWITTDANAAHNAVFGFSVLGRERGEAWDVALGAERTVTSLNGGAGILNKARVTTFAPGWSPGDAILFKLARKAVAGADDVDQDARVLQVVVSYTGQFAQSFYPLAAPVDLGIAVSDAWVELDAGDFGVPAGATGVILHISGNTANQEIGLRKVGSSDAYIEHANVDHFWAMCGIDGNQLFEVYLGTHVTQSVHLVGYTATGVVFFDNGIEKIPGGFGAWQNIDCSAECPNAIGIIFELRGPNGVNRWYKIRKNGSADSHQGLLRSHTWHMMGCDAAQLLNVDLSQNDVHLYVIGYVTEGAVFNTDGTRKMPVNPGVYEDIDCSADAPAGVMIFFEAVTSRTCGIRKNGDSEDIYEDLSQMCGSFVACDSGQIVEIKTNIIDGAPTGYYLIGYATWAA